MIYLFLILINIILAFSLFSWKQQYIEELASIINEKELEEQRAKIQILREEEQLRQSIANISHDLRTPLTSIQGYLTLLRDCENRAEQINYLSIIQTKADYLTDLVQIFYDLSLIDRDDYTLETEKLDINKIVTDCLIEKYNELKEIIPKINTENTPVWIIGNSIACKRIIENLITNAIRYSDNYIEISIDANGIFTIKNSALELKDIDVNILFNKFYTADTSRSNGNTRLGLYIVKELLTKIEGGIKEISYDKNILTISVYFNLYHNP